MATRSSTTVTSAFLAAHGVTAAASALDTMVVEAVTRLQSGLDAEVSGGLTATEVDALRRGGFDPEPRPDAPDPLAEGVAEFAAMMKTALPVHAAAARAGVNASRIRQRLNGDPATLLGVRIGREWRVPAFQFDGASGVLPGLEHVIPALDPDLHPLAVQRWFLTPNDDLTDAAAPAPISPRDWLRHGLPPASLVELARGL